ncbi:MAG TPA: AbrB/MazE/SpoVT family DNA-binding domain-containing protein [Candidatus Dormibacteraeota bacterium]
MVRLLPSNSRMLYMRELAKLSSKNQATVPAAVRRALNLRAGDRMVFEIVERGAGTTVTVHRYPTLDELAGSVPVPPEVRDLAWPEIRERAWAPPPPSDPPAPAD